MRELLDNEQRASGRGTGTYSPTWTSCSIPPSARRGGVPWAGPGPWPGCISYLVQGTTSPYPSPPWSRFLASRPWQKVEVIPKRTKEELWCQTRGARAKIPEGTIAKE